MGKLNVNLPDLSQAADSYAELQARAAAIGPRALEEVNRVIASHGVMGYPVAVGVVAGLARRQGPLDAQTAQFGLYSTRFHEHIAAYSSADQEAARRFDAIRFPVVPEGDVPAPKPPDDDPKIDSFDPVTCWIAPADGDTSVCSPDTTEYIYVEDGTWKLRQADSGSVDELDTRHYGGWILLPNPPVPESSLFDGAPKEDVIAVWPNPDGTMGYARRPEGDHETVYRPSPPGDLGPMWGKLGA